MTSWCLVKCLIAGRRGVGAGCYGGVGRRVDELEYDPYGNVRRTRLSDFTRDGVTDTADLFAFLDAWYGGTSQGVHPSSDMDDDGLYGQGGGGAGPDVTDLFMFMDRWYEDLLVSHPRARLADAFDSAETGSGGVGGILTPDGEFLGGPSQSDNPYGYCGYYFDVETAAAQVLGPELPAGSSLGGDTGGGPKIGNLDG